jgi:hypothetical protein
VFDLVPLAGAGRVGSTCQVTTACVVALV